MKKFGRQLSAFFSTPFGVVVVFVVVFYAMTFGVYYFYSPGPEERRQAEVAPKDAQARATTVGRQVLSVEVRNSLIAENTQKPTQQSIVSGSH
jgi:hypothetical protein